MKIEKITIKSKDGYPLSALLLNNISNSKGIIQFHNGTVAKKEFYLPFCEYIAEMGYSVIMFDYRGIGESKPKKLKNFNATITDWSILDMTSILKWSIENYPKKRKYIIAHSMGGQIIGLMDNYKYIDGIITIAGSYGNWRNYTGINKLLSAIIWLIYFPISLRIFGYLPLKFINMGEDLPKGAAKQLWSWCLSNKPHSYYMDKNEVVHYYDKITQKIKAYYIDDDIIATSKVIPLFEKDYQNSNLEIEIIKPHEYNIDHIGHYGFFNEKYRNILWKKVVNDIDNFN